MPFLPLIHGFCAFCRVLLTPLSTAPSPPPSQITVCNSRFARLRTVFPVVSQTVAATPPLLSTRRGHRGENLPLKPISLWGASREIVSPIALWWDTKVFRPMSTLLENSSPSFRQHVTLSLPRFGVVLQLFCPYIKSLLMLLFLMGCFPVDFQEVKRPLRTKAVKRPIKVGKRPINERKRPIKAKVLVGVSVGCLMGCFRAPPPWRKTAPLKRPIKRSMIYDYNVETTAETHNFMNRN